MKNEIKIIVRLDFELSFWQAIKLRLAGKGIKTVIDGIVEKLKDKYKDGGIIEHGDLQDGSKIIPNLN